MLLGWLLAIITLSISIFIKNKLIIFLLLKNKNKNQLKKEKKNKIQSIFFYFLINFVFLTIKAIIVIFIVLINLKFNDKKTLPDVGLWPINIIIYIIGIFIYFPILILDIVLKKFKKKPKESDESIFK
ncbi:hypothetical protein [[Mycoplasma] collis]|uniref:hypothetical protein n=1 Tax=[Mycoplasma] collis TaxID=2127 RepID=UPI000AF49B0E|nr:hypothetical protein [[Mycoplasma] collis]